ncbi:tyrosine-type recombinase/integrase [Gulosibacter chungangensis]|uniref:tyrosine-type recombinase/integrase n=1 Tax=Gulosibacter chungangensis TaxID=979746 RepID=UPI00178818AF|nr:tyrosine-type recombinase/integrase [Gulosibacter chungangensis]
MRDERQPEPNDLVFLSTAGTPVDPKNFVRTFHEIRDQAGLPRITVHHTRHTAATLLKNLGVPVRDVQLILGHSNITTTQELYQHGDVTGQREALERVAASLTPPVATLAVNGTREQASAGRCRQLLPSNGYYAMESEETQAKKNRR